MALRWLQRKVPDADVSVAVLSEDNTADRYALLMQLYGVDTSGGVLPIAPYFALKPTAWAVDTAIYAAGEVLSDVLEIANFFAVEGGVMNFSRWILTDKDDETAFDMRLWLLDANTPLGTKNSSPNISDSDAGSHILGYVDMAAGDAIDVGGAKFYQARFAPFEIKAAAASRSLFLQLQISGTATPTFASASDLVGFVGGFS